MACRPWIRGNAPYNNYLLLHQQFGLENEKKRKHARSVENFGAHSESPNCYFALGQYPYSLE